MIQTLIGQKKEQTQKFLETGRRVPVTKIFMPANAILQVKTAVTDGYAAVQLGFGGKKKVKNPIAGHVKKAGVANLPKKIKEVKLGDVDDSSTPKQGDMIAVASVFKLGDIVAVTGTSKGKGFAGVVKRYNFRGGPKTHGQSDRHRAPGSIGQSATPGRVYKGKRMAGRMGQDTVTVQNLTVVGVDETTNTLLLTGLVPGHVNSFLIVTKTGEMKNFVPLLQKEEENVVSQSISEEENPEEEAHLTQTEETVVAESSDEPKEEKEDAK